MCVQKEMERLVLVAAEERDDVATHTFNQDNVG